MINGEFMSRFLVKEADILAHRTNRIRIDVHDNRVGSVLPSAIDQLDGNILITIKDLEFQTQNVTIDGPFGNGTYFAQSGSCTVTQSIADSGKLVRSDRFNNGLLFIGTKDNNDRYRVLYQGSLKSSDDSSYNTISLWAIGINNMGPSQGDGAIEIDLFSDLNPKSLVSDNYNTTNLYGNITIAYDRNGVSIASVSELSESVDVWNIGNKAIITKNYDDSSVSHVSVYFNDENLFLGNNTEYKIIIGSRIISSNELFFVKNRQQIFYDNDNSSEMVNGGIVELQRNDITIGTAIIDDYGTPTLPTIRHIRVYSSDKKLLTQDGQCNVIPEFKIEFHGSGEFPSSDSNGTMFDLLMTDIVGDGDFIADSSNPFDSQRSILFDITKGIIADVESTVLNDWDGSVFLVALQGTNFIRLFIPTSHGATLSSSDKLTITMPELLVRLEDASVDNIDIFGDCFPPINCQIKQSENKIGVLNVMMKTINRHAGVDFPYVFGKCLNIAQVAPPATDTSIDGRDAIYSCNYTSSNESEFIENAVYHESGLIIGIAGSGSGVDLHVKLQKLNDTVSGYNELELTNPFANGELLETKPLSDGNSIYYAFSDSGELKLAKLTVNWPSLSMSSFSTTFDDVNITDSFVTLASGVWDGLPVIILTGVKSSTSQTLRIIFDPIDDTIIFSNVGGAVTASDFSAQSIMINDDEIVSWFMSGETIKVEVSTGFDVNTYAADLSSAISSGTVDAINLFKPTVSNDRFMWMNFGIIGSSSGDVGCLMVFDNQQKMFSNGPIISGVIPRNLPLGKPSGDRNGVFSLASISGSLSNVALYTVALKQGNGSFVIPEDDETGIPVIGSVTDDGTPGDYDIVLPFNTELNFDTFMISAADQIVTGFNPCEDNDCGIRNILFVHFAIDKSIDQCAEA
jgi:hypothetical protein